MLAARRVVGVAHAIVEKDPILDRERRQVAGTHADECERCGRRLHLVDAEAPALLVDLQQRLLGCEERRLEGSRAVDDTEDLAGHAGHQAVPARLLLLAQPDRQVRDPADLVEHDPAIARHGAENPEPLLPQMLDEVLESRLRQPPHRSGDGAAVSVRAHARARTSFATAPYTMTARNGSP